MLKTSANSEQVGTQPKQATTLTPSVNALTAEAVALRRAGKFNGAAQTYAKIADMLPGEWLAQYNCGAAFLEVQRLGEAVAAFERVIALNPSGNAYTMYAHTLALNGSMQEARSAYEHAVAYAPDDFTAHWGLFEVCQLLDDNLSALRHQRVALKSRSIVTTQARVAPARTTILELCVPGTFQANIPLDFILDLDTVTVHKLYLGDEAIPALPPYDIVFNTIAEASNVETALSAAARFAATQERPLLNAPELIMATARDAVAERFRDSRNVLVADTARLDHAEVATTSMPFPLLIRPLDSHAGDNLAKIDDRIALEQYTRSAPDVEQFYLTQFIDYRSPDAFYRKYRIVFVDGVPYPVHMAISPHWMIHYYNAPMAENAWMREEEHLFLRDMSAVFTGAAADGLRDIAAAFRLDYFGIDCGLAADGRVLLFEASTAMIVHMRDPVDLYPYKHEYVPRVIRALERLIDDRIGRHRAS